MDPSNQTGSCCQGQKTRYWYDEKAIKELEARLNRIEGQIRGIKRMITEQVYCDDILNQIASAQSSLQGVARLLLEKHLKNCVKEQLVAGEEEILDEVLKTVFRMMK
jgi:DNA-binding FrmR family transcriptional regulator